jgi:hypothetical protein
MKKDFVIKQGVNIISSTVNEAEENAFKDLRTVEVCKKFESRMGSSG